MLKIVQALGGGCRVFLQGGRRSTSTSLLRLFFLAAGRRGSPSGPRAQRGAHQSRRAAQRALFQSWSQKSQLRCYCSYLCVHALAFWRKSACFALHHSKDPKSGAGRCPLALYTPIMTNDDSSSDIIVQPVGNTRLHSYDAREGERGLPAPCKEDVMIYEVIDRIPEGSEVMGCELPF